MSESYRPRSPDLSAYSPQPPRLSYAPTPPTIYPPHHRDSYDASPFFSPQTATPSQSYFGNQPHAPPQTFTNEQPQYFSAPRPFHPEPPPPLAHFYNAQQQEPIMPRIKKQEETDEYMPEGPTAVAGIRSSKKGRKLDSGMKVPPGGGPSHGIEVKTKFPVARIKRIMQADEDVGKVAQATPTAVSKALELFMITLVTKAATEAREKSSKRITAAHLKSAVAKDEVLDFLNEIIEKVPDMTEAKGKSRARSDSVEPIDEGKRRKVSRKKKSEADD